MLAHTTEDAVGVRRIGDGSFLTASDRFGNEEVDTLAKLAVDRPQGCKTPHGAANAPGHMDWPGHCCGWQLGGRRPRQRDCVLEEEGQRSCQGQGRKEPAHA